MTHPIVVGECPKLILNLCGKNQCRRLMLLDSGSAMKSGHWVSKLVQLTI